MVVIADATYFGKRNGRTELDGLLVFLDSVKGEVLWFKFIKSETNKDYQEGLDYLETRGFEILGVVTDGRKGLARIFDKYPYQVCQFHIQKGVRTLLTKNPKSEAGKYLYTLNKTFIKLKLTKLQFLEQLENYLKNHQAYVNEMSETNPNQYKHIRLRKALRKYQNNIKYMFTFQNSRLVSNSVSNSDLKYEIPNTTNHIDGGLFSPMKNLLRCHNGLSKENRKKLITVYLNSRGKI